MSKKITIPPEALQAMRDTANVLFEAIEQPENTGKEFAFRKMAAQGTYDSTPGGSFQVIVEICVDERMFLKDGEIDILVDDGNIRKGVPFMVRPAKNQGG